MGVEGGGDAIMSQRELLSFSVVVVGSLQRGPVTCLQNGQTSGLLFAAVISEVHRTDRGSNLIPMYILCWFLSSSSRFK